MNRTCKALSAAGLLLLSFACTDPTVEPSSTATEVNIFKDQGSYRAFLAKIYAGLATTGAAVAGGVGGGGVGGCVGGGGLGRGRVVTGGPGGFAHGGPFPFPFPFPLPLPLPFPLPFPFPLPLPFPSDTAVSGVWDWVDQTPPGGAAATGRAAAARPRPSAAAAVATATIGHRSRYIGSAWSPSARAQRTIGERRRSRSSGDGTARPDRGGHDAAWAIPHLEGASDSAA